MTWEALFDDLTSGLESEWEYERAAREAEQLRLHIARLTAHERFAALAADRRPATLMLRDGRALAGDLVGVGADWVALHHAGPAALHLVPEAAIVSVVTDTATLRACLPPTAASGASDAASLTTRMTFGYIARDLARRRVPVFVHADGGWQHHGTIDRAGADHLDIAVHDRDVPRRSSAVRTAHLLAFAHVTSITIEPGGLRRVY